MPRITPIEPPYDPDTAVALQRWMPPGTGLEPLALFRVLARHEPLFSRMRPLGAGILAHGRLEVRQREILIHRTTARAGAAYEWGVHAAAFAAAAGLTDEQVRATAVGEPGDPAWEGDPEARLLLRIADALFDHDTIPDDLWLEVSAGYPLDTILEMVICCGWYRLLSAVIRTAELEPESWARPFPA